MEACFARATQVLLAVNNKTSVTYVLFCSDCFENVNIITMSIKLDQMIEEMSKLFCEHFFPELLPFSNLVIGNIPTTVIASSFKLGQLIEDKEKIT